MSVKPPKHISTVDGETYQVRGEDTVYDDMIEANKRARKMGPGIEVIRLSDGKVVSTSPVGTPAPPPRYHQ